MRTDVMTPRERWLAVIRRQKPDRTPTDYWGTPETGEKLRRYLGAPTLTDALDRLHVDYPIHVYPRYVGPALPPDCDVFGIAHRDIDYGTGVYPETSSHPLAGFGTLAEIEANYGWPDPDGWDYSEIPSQVQRSESRGERIIRGGGSEPFLTYKDLRGDEQALVDLVEHPDIVEYCLGKLFDLAYTNTLRIYEAIPGRVDISYVAEDMGAQTGLMFSPLHIRRFLFPGMKRMIDLAHSAGVSVFHHNDGNITRILPELVDLGIDLLNPIQWRADGMDRVELKQRFGSRLIFHGAVDNQYTLPFGSVAEVRQEVRDNLRILGEGGGYILAPCHNIQPLTPVENIVAMFETAYEEG